MECFVEILYKIRQTFTGNSVIKFHGRKQRVPASSTPNPHPAVVRGVWGIQKPPSPAALLGNPSPFDRGCDLRSDVATRWISHIIIFVAKGRSGGRLWFVGELLQFWCSDSIHFLFILLLSSETFSIKLILININQTIFKHTHLSLQCNKNVSL